VISAAQKITRSPGSHRLPGDGQEGERAKNMENPTTRGPIESAARRYAALAEKLEAARKK